MLIHEDECEDYIANVAELMERYGIVLVKPATGEDLVLIEDDRGALGFELIGELRGEGTGRPATIEVREELAPLGEGTFHTTGYEYELIDRSADYRRAFHLHHPEEFGRRYLVLVHEHCESPLGQAECEHYSGMPLKDSYAGLTKLLDAWTEGPIDCRTLICLD